MLEQNAFFICTHVHIFRNINPIFCRSVSNICYDVISNKLSCSLLTLKVENCTSRDVISKTGEQTAKQDSTRRLGNEIFYFVNNLLLVF